MADLYLTPAERYTAALGGFYYGDLPEPGTVYTQLIKDILNGTTPEKEPKNILARFIYSLYISDLGDPYPRYELAKLLYWKLHDITPTKSGSILTVTIDGKEDYMTINTDLSRLWYKVLFGSKTDVITEFPYIFNTMQNKLSDWELFGNVEVSDTPTPDNPVMPEGTGERTGNLLQNVLSSTEINGVTVTVNTDKSITVNGSLTVGGNTYVTVGTVAFESGEKYTIDGVSGYLPSTLQLFAQSSSAFAIGNRLQSYNGYVTRTAAASETCYIRLYFYPNVIYDNVTVYPQIVKGDAKPYEPYGYKIPISSAGQTTPVYLGEVETTRRVKKLVLTGQEDWSMPYTSIFRLNLNGYLRDTTNVVVCTHYRGVAPVSTVDDVGMNETTLLLSSSGNNYFYIHDSRTNINNFTTYLQQQYAAGTPVTVWYVLVEPETGIVNEPLMKIGEYADSLSRAQAGVDIPTVVGQNTLDVLTIVKPSSMRIEYTSADETRSRSKRISLLKYPLKKGLIK